MTVVIPAYNAARTIGSAIDSVMAQTFDDFEVVVVDDGSTDDTRAIARRYGERVRCVQQLNAGPSAARNHGIRESRGELIALLDADDLWRPEKLERQVAFMRDNPSIGVSYTAALRVDEALAPLAYIPASHYDDYCAALLLHSAIVGGGCSAVIMRRELAVASGGFPERYRQSEDWEYWLRLSRMTHFGPIDEPLVLYRMTPGSGSANVDRMERNVFAILDAFYAGTVEEHHRRIRSRVYSNHWMILCGSYFRERRTRDAFRCGVRSLLLCPSNMRRPAAFPLRWIRRRYEARLPTQT